MSLAHHQPMHDAPYSVEEIAYMLQLFRVHELQEVLLCSNLTRHGKKHELVNRITDAVRSGPTHAPIDLHRKVGEVYRRRGGQTLPMSDVRRQMSNYRQGGASLPLPQLQRAPNYQQHQSSSSSSSSNTVRPYSQQAAQARSQANSSSSGSTSTYLQQNMGRYVQQQQPLQDYSMYKDTAQQSATNGNGSVPEVIVYGQRDLPNVKMVSLPFFDPLQTLIQPTILVVRNSSRMQDNYIDFVVPPNYLGTMNYDIEKQALPRSEVQFRCFCVDPTKEQTDDFPAQFALKCNDRNVTLPPIIPTNKPNAEQKRYSRPVDLTSYCQPFKSPTQKHRLVLTWAVNEKKPTNWFFVVRLVRRVSSDILLRRLQQKDKRPAAHIKKQIIQRLALDADDDVATDSLRVSLQDPLMMTRMVFPGKGEKCTHLQCFDVNSYLKMNERRPTWKCSVCPSSSNSLPYEQLIIEGYFEDVLKQLVEDRKTREIELQRDGSWKTVKDDDDDDEPPVPKPPPPAQPPHASHHQSREHRSSSNVPPSAPPAVIEPMPPSKSVTPNSTKTPQPEEDIPCIDLSDSDDDTPPPPPPPPRSTRQASNTRASSATPTSAATTSAAEEIILLDSPPSEKTKSNTTNDNQSNSHSAASPRLSPPAKRRAVDSSTSSGSSQQQSATVLVSTGAPILPDANLFAVGQPLLPITSVQEGSSVDLDANARELLSKALSSYNIPSSANTANAVTTSTAALYNAFMPSASVVAQAHNFLAERGLVPTSTNSYATSTVTSSYPSTSSYTTPSPIFGSHSSSGVTSNVSANTALVADALRRYNSGMSTSQSSSVPPPPPPRAHQSNGHSSSSGYGNHSGGPSTTFGGTATSNHADSAWYAHAANHNDDFSASLKKNMADLLKRCNLPADTDYGQFK